MKKLQQNYTTPEQSKRLLELGLPADSADCYYTRTSPLPHYRAEYTRIPSGCKPCWSVGRLIEIYHICVGRGFSFNVCFPNLMNEIMYKLGEAKSNGWLDLSKLEE